MKLIIIGHRGSGKTTIGREISRIFQIDFYDLDEILVNKNRCSTITQLYKKVGELKFRELESELLSKFRYNSGILSLGGGALDLDRNEKIIKRLGTSLYLKTPNEQVIDYFLKNPIPNITPDEYRKKIKHREKSYQRIADIIIDSSTSLDDIADQVVERINGF